MVQQIALEVMNDSNVWQDLTADVMRIEISKVGQFKQRYAVPAVGRLKILLKDPNGTYVPALQGVGTGETLDNLRRVRVRDSGESAVNKMQATLSGTTATTETDTTGSNTSGILVQGPTTWWSQRVVSSVAGIVKAVAVTLVSTGGSGVASCSICKDNGGSPGVVLATTTFDVTTNPSTISLPTCALVDAVNPVHIVFGATGTLQYQIRYNTAGYTYNAKSSTDAGVTFPSTFTNPLRCGLIVYTSYCYDEQTVSNTGLIGDTYVLAWEGKAQFDSQVNKDYVQYITSTGEASAVQTNTYTNKWTSKSFTYSLLAGSTSIKPRFFQDLTASLLGTTTGIEYRNFTLRKNGGSNLLTNGNFASGSASPWTPTSAGGVTLTLSVTKDYWVLFQGFIENIYPSRGTVSPLNCTVTGFDWVNILMRQNVLPLLQENTTADAIIQYALSFLTPLTFNQTPPGTLLDVGKTTIDAAFDGVTQNTLSILEICSDAARDEGGRFYVDRDGTMRFKNRDFLPKLQLVSPAITLRSTDSWGPSELQPGRVIDTIVNSEILTYRPRSRGGSVQALGNAAASSPIMVPAVHPDGSPGQVTVTITYRDSAGNLIGGKNLVPLVAHTDYTVFENPNGNGVEYTDSARFFITNAIYGATQTVLTLNNTAAGQLYVPLLQVRGNPVTKFDPVQFKYTNASSISTYQETQLKQELMYANDQAKVESLGRYQVAQFKNPFMELGGVVVKNLDKINGVELASLELYDIVAVNETHWGMSNTKHFITGVNYVIEPSASRLAFSQVELILERYDMRTFFILGDPTYGRLGHVGNNLYI